jgi:hypothetical protein
MMYTGSWCAAVLLPLCQRLGVTYLMEDLVRHLGEPVNPSYRRGL